MGQSILLEQRMPGCIVAFCDRDRSLLDAIVDSYHGDGEDEAAGHFKADAGISVRHFKQLPFYDDPQKMLTEQDVDTVIVSTWCCSHYEMVRHCVRHGVNILLEKPVAIAEEEVDGCWRLLKDYPKVATVNFTMRGAPVTLAATKHVRGGTIGDLVSVQYVNNVHYGDVYFRKWMRTRANVGSLLLQKATHDFDVINHVIGLRPVRMAAFGSRRVYGGDRPNDLTCDACDEKWTCPMSIHRLKSEAARPLPPPHQRLCVYAREIDIDDNHTVIIEYEGGVTASYSQTFNAPQEGRRRGGSFIGTGGILDLKYYGQFLETADNQIVVGNSEIEIVPYHQKPGTRIRETYDWAGQGHFDGNEPGIRAKIDLIAGRPTDVANTIEEGYISAKMCLAAQRSIETEKVVELKL